MLEMFCINCTNLSWRGSESAMAVVPVVVFSGGVFVFYRNFRAWRLSYLFPFFCFSKHLWSSRSDCIFF